MQKQLYHDVNLVTPELRFVYLWAFEHQVKPDDSGTTLERCDATQFSGIVLADTMQVHCADIKKIITG